MRLFRFELGKLLRLPMLWCFLALSLALNGALLMTGSHDAPWYRYVASVLPVTGQRTNAPAFPVGLDMLPADSFRERLREQTATPQNTLSGLDTAALGKMQAGYLGVTGRWADIFAQKYDKLQPVVDEAAASGAPYDVYAGEATYDFQVHLTGIMYHAVLTEALLLAVLLTLCTLGCEEQNYTSLIVYATRTGRVVNTPKLAAAIFASLLCYLVLSVLTLVPFAWMFRLRDYLSMNVSSSFNYILVGTVRVPFLTWRSFTLAGYLGATFVLGAVLVCVFVLCAAVCGLVMRNTYTAFLLWFVASVGSLALPVFCGDAGLWGGYFLGLCLPVPVWRVQREWFTVLGGASFLPWHETVCTLGDLAVFAVLAFLAERRFRRKDMV